MDYLDNINNDNEVGQELVEFNQIPEESSSAPSDLDLMRMLRRRWWVIVLIAGIVYAIGIPTIFFKMKKNFRTAGAIEVAPIIPAILYQDSESARPLPNYDGFKNTQAAIMGSDKVLRRVADELKPMNLQMFEDTPDLHFALRKAIDKQEIMIQPDQRSYLIRIEMTTPEMWVNDAKILINSIIQNYMAVAVEGENREDNAKLAILQDEYKQFMQKLEGQRETIRQLMDEFGTGELTSRQELQFEQMASLQRELTDVEIQLLAIDTQIQVLENGSEPSLSDENFLQQRNEILENDPTLLALNEDLRQYERQILISRQTMHPNNPELVRQEQVLQTLRDRREERMNEVTKEFEENFQQRQQKNFQLKLNDLKNQRIQLVTLQERLQKKLVEQDSETIQLGRKQFTINDQREQLQLTKDRLQQINERIEELSIERRRPARISVADEAISVPVSGKRKKMAAAVGFGGLALGVLAAFLLHKTDKRIMDPEEMVKRVQVRILGTTTNPNSVKQNLLPQQLNDDYQTIRANLGLLNGQSGEKIILISSPGVKDGKTTFSINLATSFANSGKKTLLIDADLRKPDVAIDMNLPPALRGFQDYLFGKNLDACLYRYNETKLYILASDFRNSADALDLLAHPQATERIRKLKDVFEIVIIDSPPVLAFADSLVLARIADAVILTTFLGHTSQTDTKEAINRLKQIGANIIGTVVNNVKVDQGYRVYGYGYGYAYGGQKSAKKKSGRKKDGKMLLVASQKNSNSSDASEHSK